MEIKLTAKRALVTGANSGIGEAIALALADAGAKVAVNYVVHPEAGQDLAGKIRDKSGDALTLEADVGDPDQVARVFDHLAPLGVGWTCSSTMPVSTARARTAGRAIRRLGAASSRSTC